MAKRNALITDFDNTLYDWFHTWFSSFNAMLVEIERISGIDRQLLFPEIREIHQKYGTSEYAFLIEEMPSLIAMYPGQNLAEIFDPAIHAYRRSRRDSLKLYPGVEETLKNLQDREIKIVLYTESLAFYTANRVRKLGLDGIVDVIYSPPDHELPERMRTRDNGNGHTPLTTDHRHIPEGELKPNPKVLIDIVQGIGAEVANCVYLGDSLMKDVAMAQDAGVLDIWAKYGQVQHKEEYELLRNVSHWKETDVQKEKTTSTREVTPNNSLEEFSGILKFF